MILMIDNYDSFTYNIVQYLRELGAELKIIRNDELSIEDIRKLNVQKIVISPGPSTPDDAGISLDVIKTFGGTIPIFGICLGHQAIGQAFGARVVRAERMMHGKTSQINVVASSPLFVDMPSHFTATRYHSLIVEKKSVPDCVKITALSDDDGEIMALEIVDKHIYGVQFHPESILSEYGRQILSNFLRI